MTKTDYVDLLNENDENIKSKITKLVKMKNFFPACDFCDGRLSSPANVKNMLEKV